MHHGYRGMKDSDNQLQKGWDTPTKKWPFLLQFTPGHRSVRYNTELPPPSHSKLFLQVLRYGLVLLATLIRGGGGITSTRSWTGHLCQNRVQCLKYFCNSFGSSFKSCNSSISNCVFWRVESIPLKRNPKFLWEAKGKIRINNALGYTEREGGPDRDQTVNG